MAQGKEIHARLHAMNTCSSCKHMALSHTLTGGLCAMDGKRYRARKAACEGYKQQTGERALYVPTKRVDMVHLPRDYYEALKRNESSGGTAWSS